MGPRMDEHDFNNAETMRGLDPASIKVLVEEVEGAKSRGWSQGDLSRWFKTRGVSAKEYKSVIAGHSVIESAASVFTQISVTGMDTWPVSANPEDIRRHIEWLVEPARGDYDDALFEIAYDTSDGPCKGARLFGLDEIEEAVKFAVERNARANTYICFSLKLPDANRTKRSSAADFYIATTIPIDIDAGYDETRARMAAICDDGMVVLTGMTPERRSHHWTRLLEPCDDEAVCGTAFRALVAHSGADMKVKDTARLMRLGGTVAYPDARKRDKGYLIERTTVTINADAKPTSVDYLAAMAADDASLVYSGAQSGETPNRPSGTANEIKRNWTGVVEDGREAYFRNLVLAHVSEYQRETGADPTAQEIFDSAFAVFSDPHNVNNDDVRWTSPKGQADLMARVQNTLRRLRGGQLARLGMYSVETGMGAEQAQAVAANRETDRAIQATFNENIDRLIVPTDTTETVVKDGLRASPYVWVDATKIPPRDILYGKHYFRKFLSATVSPGGIGKSSNAIVEALAMVTGEPLVGEPPQRALKVWYWNGEDPMEELQRRIAAACLKYKIGPDALAGNLFVDSGRDSEIVIAREDRVGFQIAHPVVARLIEEVRANGIDTLIIDPFVASHAVSENDNTKIEAVVRQWMRVAEEANCSIELVHHVRKSNGQNETTVEDARGAGALLAKVRSARVLNAMTKTEAAEVGVEEKDRFSFFRIDNGKSNLMPRGEGASWRKMEGVPLGNRVDAMEDNVGVTTAWTKPDIFADLKDHHRVAVVNAVRAGEWRDDVRSSNWVGLAVAGAMGIDIDEPTGKAKVKSLVRLWTKTGVFRIIQGLDQQRKLKAFVIAPEPEE